MIDSRLASDGDQVRRRRECSVCKERFTTHETAELSLPRIIKRNDVLKVFSEKKLRAGIQRALEKRPVKIDEIDVLISRIKKVLAVSGEREFSSRQLGELVMKELSAVDHVAFIRFASVYRSFEDVKEFSEMIEQLNTQ